MNSKRGRFIFICLIILGLLFFLLLPSLIRDVRLKNRQLGLATSYNVKIYDYPYPGVFPTGYFYEILKPGMNIEKIHQIVKGYQFVFHCFDDIEVYYFFTVIDREAIRFMIFYDNQRGFIRIRGDDTNSSTFFGIDSLNNSTSNCYQGLLGQP